MKRLANALAYPTVICFVLLILWSEKIEAYSGPLYLVLKAVFMIGFVVVVIQSRRDSDKAIGDRAVEAYKKSKEVVQSDS
jgi:hypothetical protein